MLYQTTLKVKNFLILGVLVEKRYYSTAMYHSIFARVGNFIIGASGPDKQTLCGSSVACAAPTISAVNKIKKKKDVCHSSYNSFKCC